MSDNLQSVNLDILRSIQESVSELRKEMQEGFSRVDERFARVDDIMRKQRRDTAGILVIMKATRRRLRRARQRNRGAGPVARGARAAGLITSAVTFPRRDAFESL